MKTDTVNANQITNNYRIDSSFYLSDGIRATRIINKFISSHDKIYLGDESIAKVWQPSRTVLTYAGEGESYIPYIQPYDIMEYMPLLRSKISSHAKGINELRIKRGTILQTCSGRNLGPLVIADEYLESFIFGSDLIRIDIPDKALRNYVFAFFSTRFGQAMLHSNKTGSVIDHLSKEDLKSISIPILDEHDFKTVSDMVDTYYEYYSTARTNLQKLIVKFNDLISGIMPEIKLSNGWTTNVCELNNTLRIDAAFYDPQSVKGAMKLKMLGGNKLKDVADVIKPSGRNKWIYVDKEHGTPLISGRQLLQNQIVNTKYLSNQKKNDYEKFRLHEGEIAYPADGRVEGRLGTPVYITKNRSDWYASGHVGRISPHANISSGYIFLSLTHPNVQAQISSLACGSVVDAIYPNDMEEITLPPCIDFPYEQVVEAWNLFDLADNTKRKFCSFIETVLEKDC